MATYPYASQVTNANGGTVQDFIDSSAPLLVGYATPEQYGANGDGTGDDSSAITQALAENRVVRLTPGATYSVASHFIIPSNRTIVAYGARVIRSGSTNNMARNYSDGVSGGYSAANNITIMGGSWDTTTGTGNSSCFAFGHAEHIRIIHATMFNENNWHHIEFNACRFAYVDGCTFGGGLATQYPGNEAIQVDAAISSTEFPFFGPYDNTHCQHIYVTNNVFRGVGTGVGTHTPSPTTNHQNIVVEGNVFDDLYYAAVVGLTWSSVSVLNNRIQNTGYGIIMNIGTARDNNGIEISGNQMYNLGSSAYGSSTRAIYVAGNSNFKAKNVRIANNSIVSALGTSQHGIAVEFLANASIIGNNVESVNRAGIFVYGAANGVTVANNTSVSNDVSGEGYESIRLGMLNGSNANRLVVTGNFGGTLRAQYCSNSLITHNNLNTSLTQSDNTNTQVSRNIVGGSFS